MTTPTEYREEACIRAILAAIQANAETEAEACGALFCVLAAKLVELNVDTDRATAHFRQALDRARAVTEVLDTRH